MNFPAPALMRLSRRVLDGDVVFFVGSGFSVDSESNTAGRLVRRLLIRMQAMTDCLGEEGQDVRARLVGTFAVGRGAGIFPFPDDDVRRLSDRYYETNDWFCSAFGRLLARWAERSDAERDALGEAIHLREELIRQTGGRENKSIDATPLERIDPALVTSVAGLTAAATERATGHEEEHLRAAGKALFLDTMGFRNAGVMGGEPCRFRPEDAVASYGDKLLPRHQVIARLAREGFCTTTLTTNYDLLLEGAFRQAGFTYGNSEPFVPESYFRDFACIASPSEFFTEGKAHRTAVLVKIHGCAERYRRIPAAHAEALRAYLRSMVFTYREIQNWREDSWAADYLRTLLRTQTVVFCGYSVQDPVIHDTFRTVYEEMVREGAGGGASGVAEAREPGQAPAFFFAPDPEKQEFYGMEVLHAASCAIGAQARPLDPHPNYLGFHFRSSRKFPHLDELFRWLFHAVFRQRQERALAGDLDRTVTVLLRKRRRDADLDQVRRGFQTVWTTEQARAADWTDSAGSRFEHDSLCGWTEEFHTGLLREFAAHEEFQRTRGASRRLSLMRSLRWHYPSMERSGWTCWGVVVELALRRMLGRVGGEADPLRAVGRVRAGVCQQPTVVFPADPQGRALAALTIRFSGLDRVGQESRLWGQVARRTFWDLKPEDAPWPLPEAGTAVPAAVDPAGWRALGRRVRYAPDVETIWRWAAQAETPGDEAAVEALLGMNSL
ncbi:MAG: SIR2 family NAD-dependent protein deacylase [Limisphaerales bacterium]